MKDDDLTYHERAARHLGVPAGWELAEAEDRIEAEDVLARLVNMALYEFGADKEDWPIAFDEDGFLAALTAEGRSFDGGISVHVWPNDHPPPHLHILKKSERDGLDLKINLGNGEPEGELPHWATKKQLKRISAIIVENHELFASWWQKNHGATVTLLT